MVQVIRSGCTIGYSSWSSAALSFCLCHRLDGANSVVLDTAGVSRLCA